MSNVAKGVILSDIQLARLQDLVIKAGMENKIKARTCTDLSTLSDLEADNLHLAGITEVLSQALFS